MTSPILRNRSLKSILLFISFLILFQARTNAQPGDSLTDSFMTVTSPHLVGCGLDEAFLSSSMLSPRPPAAHFAALTSASFSSAAIQHCGVIDVYYEDVNSATGEGFDDPTLLGGIPLGQVRRNTMCEVLTYIQHTFDFSHINPSDPLKLYVQLSYSPSNPAPPGTNFFAIAAPYMVGTPNTVIGGFFNDYILTGSNPTTDYHGHMQVNFDLASIGALAYQDDMATPPHSCSTDLFTVLLHEMGHVLGFFSLVTFPSTSGVSGMHPVGSITNTYSKIDNSACVGVVYPGTPVLNKLILGTSGISLNVNPSFSVNVDNNYWINNKPAPDNHPLFSGFNAFSYDPGFIKSFIGHMDNYPTHYRKRSHISPGDQPAYVMAPYVINGVRCRAFTNGEIRSFTEILGYTYIGTSTTVVANHVPFSKKMADFDFDHLYPIITESAPADFTMTNNGTPIVINLALLPDISDADGDVIRVNPATLTNFRGCGDGGNNHNQLSLSAGNTIITYTPRHDFYGRAQFGFNLNDGKEDGSYYVITIDVSQGIFPAYAPGTNMVMNPGFENGTEMRMVGPDESKPYSVMTMDGFSEGKWQSINFSDGHPYCMYCHVAIPYGCGIAVQDSWVPCYMGPDGNSGSIGTSFPTSELPLSDPTGGVRYQPFDGGGRFSYYYLLTNMETCHYYDLEFDMYAPGAASPIDIPVKVGFKDNSSAFLTPVLSYTFNDTLLGVSPTNWSHETKSFFYCGAPSHILYLKGLWDRFGIDNLFLKESSSVPPPLTVSLTADPMSGCRTRLMAIPNNPACAVTYNWATADGTIISHVTDSIIIVPSGVVATYSVTVNDGCRTTVASITVTDDVIPAPITGVTSVCEGSVTSLSDVTPYGGWSSSAPSIAAVDPVSGVVTGITPGTAIITYAFCTHFSTIVVTVNAAVTPITGSFGLCAGSTSMLANVSAGGTWSSNHVAIAGISAVGELSGISTGTATITYSLGITCYATQIVTVATLPVLESISSFSPDFDMCVNDLDNIYYDYIIYNPGVPEAGTGAWSSSNTSIIDVIPPSGGIDNVYVRAISEGVATITYAVSNVCGTAITTQEFSVIPSPAPITGTFEICPGYMTTLNDAVAGGTWSSSNPAIATFSDPTSGVLTAVSAGTAYATYTVPSGCYMTAMIMVSPIIYTLTGITEVCAGTMTTLAGPAGPGTWSSSNTSVATVDGAGVVTGIAGGGSVIAYTTSAGCSSVAFLTVDALPEPIAGILSICNTGFLIDITPGGEWSSNDPSVAVISPDGTVTAMAAGTATISYTLLSTGCVTTSVVTVNSSPMDITGTMVICGPGNTTHLSDATSGGIWTSSAPSVATVDASGNVTAVSAGTCLISYSMTSGNCFATAVITISPLLLPITGSSIICGTGQTITLGDSVPGGSWSSSDIAVASVGSSGIVTGVSAGTAIITYANAACSVYKTVTVGATPVISGITPVCVGTTLSLSSSIPGGTWSSGYPVLSSPFGTIMGVAAGTAAITYVAPSGCTATAIATINPNPYPIYGDNSVCAGSVGFEYDDVAGGTWSSSDPAQATIDLTGLIWAASTPGSVTITYTLPTGCFATYPVVIHETPAPIVIPATICSGASMTLSDATPGGTWSTGSAAIATIGSSTGVVTGVSAGAVYISYTSPFGCLTASPLTISYPGEITGVGSVCMGGTIAFSEVVSGGTWSSSNTSVATVNTSGILTPVSAGVTTVTYRISTYCFATKTVTVNSLPAAITGTMVTCVGTTTTLSDPTPGGTWSSATPGVATVGSASGIVTGISSGVANIVYTSAAGCQALAFVSVSPIPSAISGPSSMCAGNAITLTNSVPGGTWSSSNVAVATIGSTSGIVSSALIAGTTTISYKISSSCYVTKVVSVNASPLPITGSSTICVLPSMPTSLGDLTPGGTWSSSNTAVATVGGGSVLGISLGSAVISYTLPNGCYATKLVSVNPSPGPITGSLSVCLGSTTTLAGSATGGIWAPLTPAIASIGSTTGIVTGLTTGTTSITYSFPSTGCLVAAMVTVTTTPALSPISGFNHVCMGSNITMTESATGGIWLSSNPTIISIGTLDGVATGISYGTAVISYVKSNSCGVSTVTKTVSVNTLPQDIAGPNSMCVDGTLNATLTDATPGGTWSSSNPAIVTINASGTMTAVSVGTATITYTTGGGCTTTMTVYMGKDGGNCTPCHELGKRPYTTWGIGGSVLNSSLSGANVYIPNTVSMNGNDYLNNSVVFMAPDIAVNVEPDAVLTVNSSHLFTCANNMWNGITLLSDAAQTGTINMVGTYGNKSTLVEDAIRAVLVKNPTRPNGGAPYYVNCNNTIFNRNNIGICVTDYNLPTAATISGGDPYAYEFHIENTVFTSRDLTVTSYPFAWPSTFGTGGLQNNITPPSPYQMPYNIINYPTALCHNKELNICGIQLNNVGGMTAPNYAGFIAGTPSTAVPFTSSNTQITLYDNLAFGIYAVNANVTSKNSVYGNMHAVSTKISKPLADNGFTGIYTAMNNTDKYRLRVEPGTFTYTVRGRTSTTESPNYFYDCQFGVYSKDYYVISGKKSNMRTTQNAIGDNSRFGYYLQSSSYSDINVNQNSIFNVANGIFISSTLGAGYIIHTHGGPDMWVPGTQQAGNIRVNSNTVQATYDGGTPTTQYNAFAITLYNIVNSASGGVVLPTGTVHTDSNTIKDAYHGITVQSYWAQQAMSNLNTINIRLDPMNSTSYGISHTDCNKNKVYSNTVTGWGSVELKSDSVRAYYMVANQNAEISCNYANNTCRGFEFFNNNAKNSWHDNRMVSNNKGLVINASAIGDQGYNHYPANNVWNTTGFDWSTRAQTYVYNGSNAINSRLIVPNSSSISVNPSYNFGPYYFLNYAPGISLIPTIPFATFPVCLSIGGGGGGNTNHRQMMERIVKKQLNYQIDSAANDWFGQMASWQAMQYDSTLTDSSDILQSFHTLAASARFAHIWQLEQSLAQGDLATVNTMLSSAAPAPLVDSSTYTDTATGVIVADDHSTDYVVDNYRAFYGLYQHYLQQSMSSDDSMQVEVIAGLCPTQYGAAVYRARCLYGTLTGILRTWNDDSCAADTTAHIAARHTSPAAVESANYALEQAYRLYPNPTSSEFVIAQQILDRSSVDVTISDMSGRTILSKKCIFSGGKVAITLPDVTSGMYMVQLIEQSGKRYSFKLLKQ